MELECTCDHPSVFKGVALVPVSHPECIQACGSCTAVMPSTLPYRCLLLQYKHCLCDVIGLVWRLSPPPSNAYWVSPTFPAALPAICCLCCPPNAAGGAVMACLLRPPHSASRETKEFPWPNHSSQFPDPAWRSLEVPWGTVDWLGPNTL